MAESDELFDNPMHPYTQALLSAVPVPDPRVEARREFPAGQGTDTQSDQSPLARLRVPSALLRCAVEAIAREVRPELREMKPGHWVACSEATS